MAQLAIEPGDVTPFITSGYGDDTIETMITGTIARASQFAPCIKDTDLDEDTVNAMRDILINVIVRAMETGSGQITTMSAGGFSQSIDTTARRSQRFRPDEIRELQSLCGISRGGAFMIDLGSEPYEPDGA